MVASLCQTPDGVCSRILRENRHLDKAIANGERDRDRERERERERKSEKSRAIRCAKNGSIKQPIINFDDESQMLTDIQTDRPSYSDARTHLKR